jgi:hypothetical protein
MSEITIRKADGKRELFSPNKLAGSLARAGANKELILEIISHVENELVNDMTSTDVYRHAFSLLRHKHKPAAARYSLRRALIGLGPTGFPFEEYVAEIFKAQGFEAVNDQILKGQCVEHEVDVVAWNDQELNVIEVKFHNEPGLKSDLKVALYVKARIDDLQGEDGAQQFFYGGKLRTITQGWLVTNTKFSERALEYGRCKGTKMIGWNYPKDKGNLQDLIERHKLHPLSCLTSLNEREKQALFASKIVLCRSLVDDPNILISLGLSPEKAAEVYEEIRSLSMSSLGDAM